jgi:hypothetical protein
MNARQSFVAVPGRAMAWHLATPSASKSYDANLERGITQLHPGS